MTKDTGMNSLWFVAPLLVLIAIGGFTLWKLWSAQEPPVETTVEPIPSRLVAARELQSFTKLTKDDLKITSGTANASLPKIEELAGRYLMVKINQGGDVKREMVAPRAATPLLSDAVAVGVQPTSLTTMGGQLQVGDMVDVVPTGSTNGAATPFEK